MDAKINAIWEQLLCIKRILNTDHQLVGLSEQHHFLSESADLKGASQYQAVIATQPLSLPQFIEIDLMNGGAFLYVHQDLSAGIQQFYRLYMPIACALLIKPDMPFVMVHVAQSLDGKVCTLNGASKWIGNDENLVHAHRIRALVDGVAVGGNTLRTEQPALTVRHVSGENPTRLIFSNCEQSLANMPEFPDTRTIVICHDEKLDTIKTALLNKPNIQLLTYPVKLTTSQNSCPKEIVLASEILIRKLQHFGVHSVMVEGGPGLISWLIKAGLVDMLQVHIAPLLFGSGKSLAAFGAIADVSQAIHLQSPFYCAMGDAMMMTAEINPKPIE